MRSLRGIRVVSVSVDGLDVRMSVAFDLDRSMEANMEVKGRTQGAGDVEIMAFRLCYASYSINCGSSN